MTESDPLSFPIIHYPFFWIVISIILWSLHHLAVACAHMTTTKTVYEWNCYYLLEIWIMYWTKCARIKVHKLAYNSSEGSNRRQPNAITVAMDHLTSALFLVPARSSTRFHFWGTGTNQNQAWPSDIDAILAIASHKSTAMMVKFGRVRYHKLVLIVFGDINNITSIEHP